MSYAIASLMVSHVNPETLQPKIPQLVLHISNPWPTAYSEHLLHSCFSSLFPLQFQHFTPPGGIAIDDGRSFNGNPVIIIASVLGGCRRGECSSVGRDVGEQFSDNVKLDINVIDRAAGGAVAFC